MHLETLKEKYLESASRPYMSFDTWLEQQIDNVLIRDFLRLEQAAWHMSDVFIYLDNTEDDDFFESKVAELHNLADKLDYKLRKLEEEMSETLGKEIIDGYLSTISK